MPINRTQMYERLNNPKKRASMARRHRINCAICTHDERNRIDYMILTKAADKDIRLTLNELGITISDQSLELHTHLIKDICDAGVLDSVSLAAAANTDFAGAELGDLEQRFMRQLLGSVMPTALQTMVRRMCEDMGGVTFHNLLELLREGNKIVTTFLGEPSTRKTTPSESSKAYSLQELIDKIEDPEEKQAFIKAQRQLAEAAREANRVMAAFSGDKEGGTSEVSG